MKHSVDQARPAGLARTLAPRSIAVVGLSDESRYRDMVAPTLESDCEIHFVHPRVSTVLGRPTVPTLSSIDGPIDVVASFVNAERSVALVDEAAGLDIGGLVVIAARFAESGPAGAELQEQIRRSAAAAGMAIVGPNGLGYVNVPRQISLTMAAPYPRRPGGISLVSHSGALLTGSSMAAWNHSGCGMSFLISAGNEAVTDVADYLDFLVGDEGTTAIGLVIESIRRPEAFFAAAKKAVEAGKPIVALKLARNERTQRMAMSHTAALAGNAWTYDVAFRQAGVALAHDPEELIDRLAMFDQIPRHRWTSVDKLGIVTRTGGFASLAYDIALEEGVDVPQLDSLADWTRAKFPGTTVANPLDVVTSFGADLWPEVVQQYAQSDELDALLMVHPLLDEDESRAKKAVSEFVSAAGDVAKPCVVANCSGSPAAWVKGVAGDAAALGRGLRPTLRGLQTLGAFARFSQRTVTKSDDISPIPRPTEGIVPVSDGQMLSLAATMTLLEGCGVPVSPCTVVSPAEDLAGIRPPFSGPYVVKLANVPHRTELNAVRIGVDASAMAATIADLRDIASLHGVPGDVAIQPCYTIDGELILGIQGDSDVGPLVVFGLGGIFVETVRKVGGRIAPFTIEDARDLVDEFSDIGVIDGGRGRKPWDRRRLEEIVCAVGRLAVGGKSWIQSLDINPLLHTDQGFVAVDGVLFLRDENQMGSAQHA